MIELDAMSYVSTYTFTCVRLTNYFPNTRWAAGIDRLALLIAPSLLPAPNRHVAIITVTDKSDSPSLFSKLMSMAIQISKSLRTNDTKTLLYHPRKSQLPTLKTAIAKAVKSNASHVVIVGENELETGLIAVKDLDRNKQVECKAQDVWRVIKHGSLDDGEIRLY
jgi:histidyl-tRNA synthetase